MKYKLLFVNFDAIESPPAWVAWIEITTGRTYITVSTQVATRMGGVD